MQHHANVNPPASSLFDRLIEQDPSDGSSRLVAVDGESTGFKVTRRQRANQMALVREQIERDLLALLSTRQMSVDHDLHAWPMVASSVLNFGIPSFSGITSSGLDRRKVERTLTEIIRRFEPRLFPESVVVRCRIDSNSCHDMALVIEALFGPEEAPVEFVMGVSICLSSGQSSLGSGLRRAA